MRAWLDKNDLERANKRKSGCGFVCMFDWRGKRESSDRSCGIVAVTTAQSRVVSAEHRAAAI